MTEKDAIEDDLHRDREEILIASLSIECWKPELGYRRPPYHGLRTEQHEWHRAMPTTLSQHAHGFPDSQPLGRMANQPVKTRLANQRDLKQ